MAAIRCPGNALDFGVMTMIDVDRLACVGRPDLDGGIYATSGDVLAVAGPVEGDDEAGMTGVGDEVRAIGGSPDLGGAIIAGRGDAGAILRPCQGQHLV